MHNAHLLIGMVIVGIAVGFLGLRYFSRQKLGSFRFWGWVGFGILFFAELSLMFGVRWVSIYFTPFCWTAYLLVIDAAVSSLKGSSRLADAPSGFCALALASIPLWLIFEAYNLRVQNWTYIGLPANIVLRDVGYGWAFATIWPAIFETADFVEALGYFSKPVSRHTAFDRSRRRRFVFLGLLCLVVPVLVPFHLGRYGFGLVWIGFVLLLDPLNYRLGGRSFLREWEAGKVSTFWSFFISGLIGGILWEFWNYWAAAKWIYIFPILQGWKVFAMPLPGYFGFPAFALECFVMYESLKVGANRLFRFQQGKRIPEQYSSATGQKP